MDRSSLRVFSATRLDVSAGPEGRLPFAGADSQAGLEKREEVGQLLGLEAGPGNAVGAHLLAHLRSVVPHALRDAPSRVAPATNWPRAGPMLPSPRLPVARGATLRPVHRLALREIAGPSAVTGDERDKRTRPPSPPPGTSAAPSPAPPSPRPWPASGSTSGRRAGSRCRAAPPFPGRDRSPNRAPKTAWQRAQPFSAKSLPAAFGISGRAELARGLPRTLAAEVGEEVDDLAAFELRDVESDASDGRHHDGSVVPEVLRDVQRGRSARKPVQWRAGRSPFAADAVALDAVFLCEEHLADPRIARLVEIVQEVEKGDQVAPVRRSETTGA